MHRCQLSGTFGREIWSWWWLRRRRTCGDWWSREQWDSWVQRLTAALSKLHRPAWHRRLATAHPPTSSHPNECCTRIIIHTRHQTGQRRQGGQKKQWLDKGTDRRAKESDSRKTGRSIDASFMKSLVLVQAHVTFCWLPPIDTSQGCSGKFRGFKPTRQARSNKIWERARYDRDLSRGENHRLPKWRI